jgi:hypothetical protein
MKCFQCGTEQDFGEKLSFRAICDRCQAWQHCCKNCKNYQPGLPNDCKIPGTEWVQDRMSANFCPEFAQANRVMQKDFKESKNKFNSLFKDD